MALVDQIHNFICISLIMAMKTLYGIFLMFIFSKLTKEYFLVYLF